MKYLIIILLLTGCSIPDGDMTYVINQGNNHSNGAKVYNSDNITFRVYIDQSWLYDNDNHWNKLIGFSESVSPHDNSLRIGWRCTDGKIVFGLYAYVDGDPVRIRGQREYNPGTWVEGSVFKSYNTYHVIIGGEHFHTKAAGDKTVSTLYPYFGGEDTAPHNMRFHFRF